MCRTRQKQQKEILSSGPTTSQRIKRGQNLINKVISPNKLSKDSSYNSGDHSQTKNPTYNCHRDHRQLKIPHTKYPKTQPTTTQPKRSQRSHELFNKAYHIPALHRGFSFLQPFLPQYQRSHEGSNTRPPNREQRHTSW